MTKGNNKIIIKLMVYNNTAEFIKNDVSEVKKMRSGGKYCNCIAL